MRGWVVRFVCLAGAVLAATPASGQSGRQIAAATRVEPAAAPPRGTPPRGATEPSELRGVVEAHNTHRARLKLTPLAWSKPLADAAGEMRDQLVAADCGQGYRARREASAVANIYAAAPVVERGGGSWAQELTAKYVVSEWAAARFDYAPATGACAKPGACAAYARMITPETRAIGCAMSVCANKGQVWVCRYE